MPDTLTVAVNPSYSSSKKTAPRILRADFGDGYSQRSGDGLNNVKRTPRLVFEGLSASDADDLEEFFEDKAGHTAFYYTLPLEGSARLWITHGDWERTYQGPDSVTVTVTFEEVFDLV